MIGVAITTRNEAATIRDLVARLAARGHRVVVADAASTDGTPAAACAAGATVIPFDERVSIRDGLLAAMRRLLATGCTRIVAIDAGGSHDPLDLAVLLGHDGDLVVGSRFLPGSWYRGRPWRALCSRLAALACNLAQPGAAWSDWTSGYRVWSRDAAAALVRESWTAGMHGWQIETLAWAGRQGYGICEAPIGYVAGRSAMNRAIAREALGVWWRLWRARGNPASWVQPASIRKLQDDVERLLGRAL